MSFQDKLLPLLLDCTPLAKDIVSIIINYLSFKGIFSFKFGKKGTANGQFESPYGIATDGHQIYVSDDSRIQVFDQIGNFISQWGTKGEGLGKFHSIRCIFVHKFELYVMDRGNSTSYVQVFALPDGKFLSQFACGKNCCGVGIAISDSHVYLSSDCILDEMRKYTLEGKLVKIWGSSEFENDKVKRVCLPKGVAIYNNKIYVADRGNHRVIVYSLNGEYQTQWGNADETDDERRFYSPYSVKIYNESIFVSDFYCIRQFDENGNFIQVWGGNDMLREPTDFIFFNGLCYVVEHGRHQIKVFK